MAGIGQIYKTGVPVILSDKWHRLSLLVFRQKDVYGYSALFILTALQLFTASALAQSLCLSFRLSGWWIIKTQRLVASFACSSHTRSGENFDHGEPCPILPFMSDDIICQGDRDVFCLTRGQSIGLALDAQAGIISIIAVALAFVLIFVSRDFRHLA